MSTIKSPVDRLAELFASEGAAGYLGEPVTVAQHHWYRPLIEGLLAG